MRWLTSLPNEVLFVGSIVLFVGVAGIAHLALELTTDKPQRERAGITAAAYMTALGSLFAILTGFLVNTEYSTLRAANALVAEQVAAASRIAWATEGLPAVDAATVQASLADFLDAVDTREWEAYASGGDVESAAVRAFGDLQATVFDVASRTYAPEASVSALQDALGQLTVARGQLSALSVQTMPFPLLLLSALAGVALIANAIVVSLRSGRGTTVVAIGIVVIVALDLALIVGVSAPFQGAFLANRAPISTLAQEVRDGRFAAWTPAQAATRANRYTCADDPAGCVEIGVGEPIDLGALLWLSEGDGGTGADSLRGVELALDYLDGTFDGKPGEVLGHPIALATVDESCTAAGGRTGAEVLLSDPKLAAAIGTTCSGAALGAADVAFNEAGTLLVSPTNTAPALTEPFVSQRFYARTAANDLIQGAVDAEFAKRSLGTTRAAVVNVDSAYSRSLGKVFGERFRFLGGTVTSTTTVDVDSSGTQLTPLLDELAAQSPEIVFFPVTRPLCQNLANAIAADPRLAQVTLLTADACLNTSVLAAVAGITQPLYASAEDVSLRMANGFYRDYLLPAYERRYGISPTAPGHANAFDATTMIVDAIRRSAIIGPGNSLSIPRSNLREAFLQIRDYAGVSGTLTCGVTGDCQAEASIGVFRAPQWPVGDAAADAMPAFSQSKTLDQVLSGR